jgi:hypothetical protein
MHGFAGSCGFVFNRALALQKELFELSGAHASYASAAVLPITPAPGISTGM